MNNSLCQQMANVHQLLTGGKTFQSLPLIDLSSCTRKVIREYFINSYDLNESLFLGLKDVTVLYKCPDRLRLPLIFYYAHTAVVYVNKLMLAGLIQERIDMNFETMFETGVDEMSWDDTENYRMGGSYKWPDISEVVEYRRKVRNIILKVIEETPLELPITMDSQWWALMMGMEHERIHLETSSVLIRQLPINLVQRPEGWIYGPIKSDTKVQSNDMIKVDLAVVTMGKPTDFPSYGWDNEYGEVTCQVPSFEASQFLVTNREFLKFVEDGGYQKSDLWTEEGWKWVNFREAKHPTFWCCDQGCKSGCGADLAKETHCNLQFEDQNGVTYGDEPTTKKIKLQQYKFRAMFDVLDMPWDWPAEVNYHEAKAFCKWKGPDYRLPAEAEHNVMRGPQLPASKGPACDMIFQKNIDANLNYKYGSSTPVNFFPPSKTGHYDVFGNVWEWVEDHFNGLTGFHTHFLYDDFSSPCFDGKHNIILGGSWISTGDEASRFARYAFRRHFFQHCGFRLARCVTRDTNRIDVPVRVVDTDVFVLGAGVEANKIYLENNMSVQRVSSTNTVYKYGGMETLEGILELEFGFRDSFASAVVTLCANYCKELGISMESAVHVGTATGRGAFELSKHFEKVLGIEMCGRLIDAAMRLAKGQTIGFRDGTDVKLPTGYNLDRVVFKQLTWIANEVEGHDVVLVTHLDRAQNPKAWLARVWEILKSDGVLVIARKDDKAGEETLRSQLEHRLKCIANEEISFEERSGEGKATVTFWRHK